MPEQSNIFGHKKKTERYWVLKQNSLLLLLKLFTGVPSFLVRTIHLMMYDNTRKYLAEMISAK